MNIEDIINENILLREENEKLKKQLENYNNSRKKYYIDVLKLKALGQLKKKMFLLKNKLLNL
jgi:hypothetical protein